MKRLLILALLVLSFNASAAIVSYDFTGAEANTAATGVISSVAGTFTYDTTAPDSNVDTRYGIYSTGLTLSYVITGGTPLIASGLTRNPSTPDVTAALRDNNPNDSNSSDLFQVFADNNSFQLRLWDWTATAVSSDALPLVLPGLDSWISSNTTLYIRDPASTTPLQPYTLTSLTPSAVPVPAAVWLFGSGLLGLIAVARRKKA